MIDITSEHLEELRARAKREQEKQTREAEALNAEARRREEEETRQQAEVMRRWKGCGLVGALDNGLLFYWKGHQYLFWADRTPICEDREYAIGNPTRRITLEEWERTLINMLEDLPKEEEGA